MTKPLRKIVELLAGEMSGTGRVLEIGSRQEKGQKDLANLREIFSAKEYVGIDMRPGRGVDRVVNAEKLPFKKESFDLVLCLETFEHAEKPWLLAKEIERVVKKSGTIIVSSQQNFPIHKHPSDYFRFTPYGLSCLFENLKDWLLIGMSPDCHQEARLNPQTVVLMGWKRKNDSLKRKIKRQMKKNESLISGHKPYRHRIKDGWKWIKRGLWEIKFKQKIEFF